MTDYADLRRLAEQVRDRGTPADWEQFESAAEPQVILALLDERDRWKKEATVRAGQTALFRRERDAADRRVAALEEGLRDLWECWDTGQDDDVLDVHFQAARAMLAAAPSEPPDEYMCPNCVTPWKCNGPHIPAALPAEVGDAGLDVEALALVFAGITFSEWADAQGDTTRLFDLTRHVAAEYDHLLRQRGER